MSFQLTQQQQDILNNHSKHNFIFAGAGSGKTSTILELIKNAPNASGFYITFNNEPIKNVSEKLEKIFKAEQLTGFKRIQAFNFYQLGKMNGLMFHEMNSKDYEKFFNLIIEHNKEYRVANLKNNSLIDWDYWNKDNKYPQLKTSNLSELTWSNYKYWKKYRCKYHFENIANSIYQDFEKITQYIVDSEQIVDFQDMEWNFYQSLLNPETDFLLSVLQEQYEKCNSAHTKRIFQMPQKIDTIFIDEFQDIDSNKFFITKLMFEKYQDTNWFIVGDYNQQIYGWRDNNECFFDKIEDYLKTNFSDTKSFNLSKNFRCDAFSVNVFNQFLEYNKSLHSETPNILGSHYQRMTPSKDYHTSSIDLTAYADYCNHLMNQKGLYNESELLLQTEKYMLTEVLNQPNKSKAILFRGIGKSNEDKVQKNTETFKNFTRIEQNLFAYELPYKIIGSNSARWFETDLCGLYYAACWYKYFNEYDFNHSPLSQKEWLEQWSHKPDYFQILKKYFSLWLRQLNILDLPIEEFLYISDNADDLAIQLQFLTTKIDNKTFTEISSIRLNSDFYLLEDDEEYINIKSKRMYQKSFFKQIWKHFNECLFSSLSSITNFFNFIKKFDFSLFSKTRTKQTKAQAESRIKEINDRLLREKAKIEKIINRLEKTGFNYFYQCEQEDVFSIGTIHASKGLEYDLVWLYNLKQSFKNDADNSFLNYESPEEIRLFYVALSRAKEKTFINCNHSAYNNNTSTIFQLIECCYDFVLKNNP